ncbi:MAG: hypothetical protein JSV88_11150 [Candidatus Aminicenantes bacterium]|nr:MAG: hypothetical protein JSV88_11150 [Candidatus Aminicenantes bacterium]
MKKIILLWMMVWFAASLIMAAKIVPLDLFRPFRIRCDGEKIFIGQEAVIYVYRAKDYKLLTKFGKAGEGPREFKLFPEYSPDFDVHSDVLVAFSIGKVSLFTKQGKFLDEKKIIDGGPVQFYRKLGDKLLGERFLRDNDKTVYRGVIIFDANLKPVKEVFRYKHYAQQGKQYSPIERGLYIPNFYIYDNKIFIGGEIGTGSIHVFDTTGKALYTIQPQLDKVKFTETDKQGYIKSFTNYPQFYERLKRRFKYPDYFPMWQNFIVADKRIYVQTYKRNKEDSKNEVVIFTLKGELIKRVWLPFDEYFDFTPCPYIIHNKKLYQCVDNEDEDRWELHITDID